jgi:4-amino-4-deoxy-L-arabinose transferase-like glycosyltransferase
VERLLKIGSIILLTAMGVGLLVTDGGATSILVIAIFSFVFVETFRRYADDKEFVTWIFLGALAARLAFGLLVHTYDLREFFGGDANTYDFRGWMLVSQWFGESRILDAESQLVLRTQGSGWGMYYFVAAIYSLLGRNILAAQSVCAVIGAATAPMAYFCAQKVFKNLSVSKTTALFVAFFPSFIIWSGQLMKDGLIIFLLVLAMTLVLRLQERLDLASVVLLVLSLSGILALRFYIFYMVAVAIGGSFIIGLTSSTQALIRNAVILLLVGVGLTYFGVVRNATTQLETYGTVDQLKRSRQDLAKSAKSGFGEDVDVTTTEGAVSTIPLGFSYLMFAPFPWQMANLRQSITLPEVLIWWAMIPMLAWGLWWSIRHRLRSAFPILIFSLMLTIAYSIFSGNVGTAYRQRTQIQVFLFIFIAVGIQLWREQRENKVLKRMSRGRARRMLGVRTT